MLKPHMTVCSNGSPRETFQARSYFLKWAARRTLDIMVRATGDKYVVSSRTLVLSTAFSLTRIGMRVRQNSTCSAEVLPPPKSTRMEKTSSMHWSMWVRRLEEHRARPPCPCAQPTLDTPPPPRSRSSLWTASARTTMTNSPHRSAPWRSGLRLLWKLRSEDCPSACQLGERDRYVL